MLEHLRIIELGQVIAGTFGGMILSDLNAHVIKVEPPRGDPGRRGAVYGIDDQSAIHLTNNRNKKSIVLDLRTPEGRDVLLEMVRHADAVIENFRPGVLARLDVDYEAMRKVNPRICLVSVSGFGAEGPYRDRPAYDLVLQAMTGHMSIMGEPDRPPVIMGIPIADLIAGVFTAVAALAGISSSQRTGEGEHFDIAMYDVMVEMLAHVGTLFLNTGRDQYPQGSAHPFITPWQAFECADGAYIVVAPREEHFWVRLCEALEMPGLMANPHYGDALARQAHRDELLPELEKRFADRPAEEWLEILGRAGVPAAPVNRMPDLFADPNTDFRDMIRTFERGGREVRVVGNAIKRARHEEREFLPSPDLGGDTEEVLRSLGYSEAEIASLGAAGAFGPGGGRS